MKEIYGERGVCTYIVHNFVGVGPLCDSDPIATNSTKALPPRSDG